MELWAAHRRLESSHGFDIRSGLLTDEGQEGGLWAVEESRVLTVTLVNESLNRA